MGTRWIRGLVAVTATFVAALGTALVPVGSASADSYEHSFVATADQVLVNRYGGITVSGKLDCSAEVADIYGGEENIPADTSVFVSKNWTATQYAGKGKVITASYSSCSSCTCTSTPTWTLPRKRTPGWSQMRSRVSRTERMLK